VCTGGDGIVLLAIRAVARLESLEIPESCLEDETNEVGEEGNKCERLQCPLEFWFINAGGRMRRDSKVIILRREDEGREPKVRKDPGNRGKVSLVRLDSREKQRGDVHECVKGSNGDPVSQMSICTKMMDEIRGDTQDDQGAYKVEQVVGKNRRSVGTIRALGRSAVVVRCVFASHIAESSLDEEVEV